MGVFWAGTGGRGGTRRIFGTIVVAGRGKAEKAAKVRAPLSLTYAAFRNTLFFSPYFMVLFLG